MKRNLIIGMIVLHLSIITFIEIENREYFTTSLLDENVEDKIINFREVELLNSHLIKEARVHKFLLHNYIEIKYIDNQNIFNYVIYKLEGNNGKLHKLFHEKFDNVRIQKSWFFSDMVVLSYLKNIMKIYRKSENIFKKYMFEEIPKRFYWNNDDPYTLFMISTKEIVGFYRISYIECIGTSIHG